MENQKISRAKISIALLTLGITLGACSTNDDGQTGMQQPEVQNRAPLAPNSPIPQVGDTIVGVLNALLQWNASDPDGDSLSFDLLLGTDQNSLETMATDLRESTYELDRLEPFVTYFWRVIAKDPNGAMATSETFSFETEATGFLPGEAGFTLVTQDEVNEFGARGFNYFLGDLTIGDNICLVDGTEIVDLSPLQDLVKVTGNLTIQHTGITNLNGLENLESLSDSEEQRTLRIQDNPMLTALEGLENFKGGDSTMINIERNPSLTRLNGLARLSHAGALSLVNNETLESLTGVDTLNKLISLVIINNPQLIDLQGLSPTLELDGSLIVLQNLNLQNLNGLNSNAFIQIITLQENPNLTDISALSGLTRVETIGIDSNSSLTNLHGLENLTVAESFFIGSNPNLKHLGGLENLNEVQGDFAIFSNGLEELEDLVRLERVNSLFIFNNNALISLEGLQNLEVIDRFQILDNSELSKFCALRPFAQDETLDESNYIIGGNAFNPTLFDLRDGVCEQ